MEFPLLFNKKYQEIFGDTFKINKYFDESSLMMYTK